MSAKKRRGDGNASGRATGGSSRSEAEASPDHQYVGGFGELEVRRVQPYEATKGYVCPGCHRDIPKGTGHYVVVPGLAPELRRHWHTPCWERRDRVRTRS